MKRSNRVLAVLLLISFSSCGIFRKDCHCPHFGKIKTIVKPGMVIEKTR